MKISFVIPNYKHPELLEACLKSFRKYHSNNETIVVDDGSPDETPKLIKPICEKYNAKLLTSFWNNGFGHCVNRGIEQSTGDVAVLVNNDITFTCNIEKEIITKMKEDEKIGIIGFLLYFPNGKIQHGGHVRLGKHTTDMTHVDYLLEPSKAKEAFNSQYVIGVTGALMAIRKKMTNEIGTFKRGYILGYEDIEFCVRTWHCGWRIFYSSKVSAIHHESYTRGRTSWLNEVDKKSKEQLDLDLPKYNFNKIELEIRRTNFPNERPEKVLFMRRGALGDCIMMTGIISEYKRQNPFYDIWVSTLYPYPFENHPSVEGITTSKDTDGYVKVFDFDFAYEYKPQWYRLTSFAKIVFDHYDLKHIQPVVYNKGTDRQTARKKLGENGIKKDDRFVVINPSSTWPCRTLSKESWDWIISHITRLKYKVIMLGTSKDIQPSSQINFYNMTDLFTLGEIKEIINDSHCFIGMDSGLMHVAMSTDVPIIPIFTSVDPIVTIWRKEKTFPIIPQNACKFCQTYERPAPVTKVECEKLECIKGINLNSIIVQFKNLI